MKTVRGQKKLIAGSTTQLLLNCSHKCLTATSSYIHVCVSLYCKKKLPTFHVLVVLSNFFRWYQNTKLWILLKCSLSATSRGIFGNFRGISKFVFTYHTISRGLLVGKLGCRLAGLYLGRVSVILSEVATMLHTNKAIAVSFQIVLNSIFVELYI